MAHRSMLPPIERSRPRSGRLDRSAARWCQRFAPSRKARTAPRRRTTARAARRHRRRIAEGCSRWWREPSHQPMDARGVQPALHELHVLRHQPAPRTSQRAGKLSAGMHGPGVQKISEVFEATCRPEASTPAGADLRTAVDVRWHGAPRVPLVVVEKSTVSRGLLKSTRKWKKCHAPSVLRHLKSFVADVGRGRAQKQALSAPSRLRFPRAA